MASELEQELLDYAKRRYTSEKRELLAMLDLKTKELEELKVHQRQLEEKNEELENLLSDERAVRMEELYSREQEMVRLGELLEKQKSAFAGEIEAGQAVIHRLNEQIASYKAEVQQLMQENSKELEVAQKEIASREGEIDALKVKDTQLEKKIFEVEAAAREEKEKLQAKILEMEQLLLQEREVRKTIEGESKNAIALSTANLLEGRAELGALREQAILLSARIKELEAEKNKIIDDWHTERKKWEDLWQRERGVWENQMAQAKEWGSRSMKERQQWEGMLRAKEEKEIRLTRVFSVFLSELNRWRGQFHLPTPEIQRADLRGEAQGADQTQKRKSIPWILVALLALLALSALSTFYIWRNKRPALLAQKAFWELPVATPAGIALDPIKKDTLWIADWKTGDLLEVSRTDPSNIVGRVASPLTFFHPNSIVFSGDGKYLFSLDSVTHKIYKHRASDPSKILEEVATPSPASLFVAMVATQDSEALAVLDTIEKKIYFFNPSALKSTSQSVVELPKNVSAVTFSGGKSLWIADAKSGRLLRLEKTASEKWVKRQEFSVGLTVGFPALPSATGFLMVEDTGELFALFDGEPGRIILAR